MSLQRGRNGSDARFTPVAEREGATGCRPRMIAGASVSRRRRWASVQREDQEGCRSREHSTGASEQRAACCDITWQVAGFNQRFPKDGRPARMPRRSSSKGGDMERGSTWLVPLGWHWVERGAPPDWGQPDDRDEYAPNSDSRGPSPIRLDALRSAWR